MTPLRRQLPDARRIPRGSGLCDCGFRRQYHVLFFRHRAGPRLHSLRRLCAELGATPASADGVARGPRLGRGCQFRAVGEPECQCRALPPLARIHDAVAPGYGSKECRLDQSRIPGLAIPPARAAVVPSSPSSITSMPIPPISHRKGPRSDSDSSPGPTRISSCSIELWTTVDKIRLAPHYRLLVRDSYDNCLAYLDERLGELFDALQRSGVLDRTLVVVAADHGEELGEHALFDHGESLYRPEIRVPLLVVLPAGTQVSGVVSECVSLRDLPATIVDLARPGRQLAVSRPVAGQTLASPMPGR